MQRKSLPTRLLLHVVLIAGAAVFAVPFVWLVGTSMMTDKEVYKPGFRLLPDPPRPQLHSPYIDEHAIPDFVQPPSVGDERWATLKPDIRQAVREQVRAANLHYPQTVDAATAEDAVVRSVWSMIQPRISSDLYQAGDIAAITQIIQTQTTPEQVHDAFQECYRRLALGLIQIRTNDFHQFIATDRDKLGNIWHVEKGPATLITAGSEIDPHVEVHYDFSQGDSFAIAARLALPTPIDNVQQVRFGLGGDETWHGFVAQIEANGTLYESQWTDYFFTDRWSEVQLQFYTPRLDDDPLRIKTWIPVKPIATGDQYNHGPNTLVLRVVVNRSSEAKAWLGKAIYNYRKAMRQVPILRYAATSIVLVILNIVLTLFSSSLVAYAFARMHWPGRDLLFYVLLGTMMIPAQVTMIPGFVIIKYLGWYNTLTPLWAFAAFGTAFNIFLLRQFMRTIPKDLEDAARIDGCGFLRVYWHVMLPLVKPTLAAIAIFTFMATWNDFLGPLIYINDQRLYTLALGLFAFMTARDVNQPLLMAGSVLMTLPVIAIFFFAQKYFIQGVTLTGMKN